MVILYNIHNHLIYVGVDQFENEDLIKYSGKFMEVVGTTLMWYHVDKYSSPHAYIRLNEGEKTVPKELQEIACQIVKEGSIDGTKQQAVDVVYTPASNLAKTKTMNPGQVSFHKKALMGYVRGVRKNNAILNQLTKIKETITLPELEAEIDDFAKGHKKGKKAKAEDEGWDDDDSAPAPAHQHVNPGDMFAGIEKAEFSTNLEDDFM